MPARQAPGWAPPNQVAQVPAANARNSAGRPAGAPGPGHPRQDPRHAMPVARPHNDPAILHVTEQTRTYPCPSCGGMLIFDPDSQAMGCPSCGNQVPISPQFVRPQPVAKRDLDSAMRQLAQLQATARQQVAPDKEVVCQSCGGRTVFAGTLTAVRCPYCNTPIQRDDIQAAPTRLPIDGILPLQISQRAAAQRIEAWINSRRFAPNAFKKYRRVGSFTSIYLPYFSYDAQTTTSYTGQRGVRRTESYQDSQGNTQTRVVTDWYPASGMVNNAFEDVTGHASNGLDDDKITELEPWPMQVARPYSPEFVAGHLSRTYDLDAYQVFGARVRPRMETVIDSTIRADIGGDEQRIFSRDTTWLMLVFCQLALPVWMLTVTFKNKPYNAVINGVTGEVQGRRPWSWIKITLAILVGVAIVAGIYWLYQTYGTQNG